MTTSVVPSLRSDKYRLSYHEESNLQYGTRFLLMYPFHKSATRGVWTYYQVHTLSSRGEIFLLLLMSFFVFHIQIYTSSKLGVSTIIQVLNKHIKMRYKCIIISIIVHLPCSSVVPYSARPPRLSS